MRKLVSVLGVVVVVLSPTLTACDDPVDSVTKSEKRAMCVKLQQRAFILTESQKQVLQACYDLGYL